MTALQEILSSFKKAPSGGPNGNGTPAEKAKALSTDEGRDAWQRLIDEKLIEWGRHPEQFEGDGYKAPSADNLVRATELVAYCRDKGVLPPLRMAPDGEGGIMFDWKNSSLPYHVVAQIHADGGMELLVFDDCKLVARNRIGAEAAV
jgi:hypothetical protein